jgi:hypothetical protein
MRGLNVRKKPAKRIASPGSVADFREGLHEPAVNRDSAGAFVEKLKSKPTPQRRDSGRIAQNLGLIRS